MDANEFDQNFDKIGFEFETQHGLFRDALVFAKGEVPDAETVEQMKQERLTAFINHIENPPPSVDYLLDADGLCVLDENGNPIPKQG
jgi:hypothetical protein